MDNIRLERINDDNFYAITKLRVSKEQKNFLATNSYSIIHAYLALIDGKQAYPFAIFNGDKPVGFLMIGYNVIGEKSWGDPNCCWFIKDSYILWRLMIDKKYQGRGYGRKAVELALDFIRTFPAGEAKYCWLSYDVENEVARELYRSFGFEEVPATYYEGGEMPAVLEL